MRYVFFKGIKFIDLNQNELSSFFKNYGLYVFPSAPGLASIENEKKYYKSLKQSNYVFFDSSFFVLLLKFFKKINVKRLSGYKSLKYFFLFLKNNKNVKIFTIDPSSIKSHNNLNYLIKLNLKKKNISNYIAPIYNPKKISDKNLLQKIKKHKPETILINLGGGTQEILGYYILKNINFKCRIICTGAAISFFTGDQAPINDFIDKYYLGWIIRLLFNPLQFYKRYFYAFKLIKIVINNPAFRK